VVDTASYPSVCQFDDKDGIMEDTRKLIVAMAEKCKSTIELSLRAEPTDRELLRSLRPAHLLCMCDAIQKHAAHWPEIKLHRWIGFIQGGMVANHLLDLEGAKRMFDDAKKAHGPINGDQDMIDHLDPDNPFVLDIGGEG
jgi:hypothetical protein